MILTDAGVRDIGEIWLNINREIYLRFTYADCACAEDQRGRNSQSLSIPMSHLLFSQLPNTFYPSTSYSSMSSSFRFKLSKQSFCIFYLQTWSRCEIPFFIKFLLFLSTNSSTAKCIFIHFGSFQFEWKTIRNIGEYYIWRRSMNNNFKLTRATDLFSSNE